MAIPFPDIDPYSVLGLLSSATPLDIKRAYKKLSLKYHPDKLQQTKLVLPQDEFTKIQFSYSILSDPMKRQRYDNTGSLELLDVDDSEGFNWREYFESINTKITIDMIEEDKARYQNSQEEEQDIINNFIYYDGDFLKLFETIPHLEFNELSESRVFEIIETKVINNPNSCLDKSTIKSWDKYKKSRKTKVKSMLKKLAREAKEAEKLEKTINDKDNRKVNLMNDLQAIIQKRQSNRLDNLITSIQLKYGDKKGTKRSNSMMKDIDDDEFEQIQKKLINGKRSKQN